jgi:hypothetical protein
VSLRKFLSSVHGQLTLLHDARRRLGWSVNVADRVSFGLSAPRNQAAHLPLSVRCEAGTDDAGMINVPELSSPCRGEEQMEEKKEETPTIL